MSEQQQQQQQPQQGRGRGFSGRGGGGGRGNGNRGRGGRGSRDSGARSTDNTKKKTTLKGACEELGSNVFTYGDPKAADTCTKTIEKLQTY